nr:hypothetical protein B0A51_05007 [Rachicladosporium sp. CCFEE 5018]
MRLLHTSSYQFTETFSPPAYGVLSHRWGDSELSYNDLLTGNHRNGEGYQKVIDCCFLAKSRGLDYVWIDTCCIDKGSSAELSESINSMWQWYSRAKECYAFLADVDSTATPPGRPFESRPYKSSAWFSRGWTLQELLAPRVVIFCDFLWRPMGEKLDGFILDELTRITPIPRDCLISHHVLHNACVAKKFSWAATRTTTRPEDMAYCLLGLLGINMPLLYGEGKKAFLRLQQEIIRQTSDESVFVWRDPAADEEYSCGLLASDVAAFAHSGDVRTADLVRRVPYSFTNQGLDLHATAQNLQIEEHSCFYIPLNCEILGFAEHTVLPCGIVVTEIRNRYSRVNTHEFRRFWSSLDSSLPAPSEVTQRFIIRLQRWDSEYEPAMVVLKRMIQRILVLRAVRLKAWEVDQAEKAARDNHVASTVENSKA